MKTWLFLALTLVWLVLTVAWFRPMFDQAMSRVRETSQLIGGK